MFRVFPSRFCENRRASDVSATFEKSRREKQSAVHCASILSFTYRLDFHEPEIVPPVAPTFSSSNFVLAEFLVYYVPRTQNHLSSLVVFPPMVFHLLSTGVARRALVCRPDDTARIFRQIPRSRNFTQYTVD